MTDNSSAAGAAPFDPAQATIAALKADKDGAYEERNGLIKGDPNKSQYQVDKLKKAVENEWRVTNTTPKGKLDQIYAYIDMARNPDDVAMILKNNEQEIANSGEKDAIEKAADDLLRWFEKQSAPSLQ